MSDKVSLVRVLTSATGNSTPITLGLAYSQLFMTTAEAGAVDGRTYTWLIVDGNNWELVKGVYTASGTTAARTTVIASRSGGTLGTSRITLSGTAQVRIVESAVDMDGVRGTRSVTGTSDALAATDLGYVVTYSNAAAVAVSLAQAGTASLYDGWATWVQNLGVGTATITPATSTINGAATLVIPTKQGAFIWSDGTNYHAFVLPVSAALLAVNNLSDVANAATARANLGINQVTPTGAAANLNTIVNPGTYYTSDSSATNAPYAGAYWYLLIEFNTSTYLKQTATRLDAAGNDTFIRTQVAGAWGAWAPVITGGPLAAALTPAQQAQARANIAATASIYFSAYLSSNQTVSLSTPTKIQFNTKVADSNSFYDSVTNYRFQPTIAGKYKVQVHIQASSTSVQYTVANIYKNGSSYGQAQLAGNATSQNADIDMIVVLNGSTDYVEAWGQVIGTGTPSFNGGTAPIQSWFEAWYIGA